MPRGPPPAVTPFMRPPLVPVPRLPVECNLRGHSRRKSLSCSPRRYSTGCSNRCPLPQGICRLDVCISSCLSCLPFEQFPVQPANLYAPWIGLPGARRGALLAHPWPTRFLGHTSQVSQYAFSVLASRPRLS